MKRILRHVGGKDFKKTHQRKLDEQNLLWQEEERKYSNIQDIKRLSERFKSDWRTELSEAMSSKDFPYIYGGVVTVDILSLTNLPGSQFAQNSIQYGANQTDYAFGSEFPGSYVNQVGGVESLSKVDVVASHDGVLPEVPEGQNPAPELPDNAIPIDTSIQGSYAVDGETRHRIYKYKNGVLQNTLNNEYLFYSNPWQIDRGLILPRNERGWALQVYGRNTGASFLSTLNIAVWQEDFVNGDVYTFRIEPVNAEGNPHLITLHASTGRPRNNSFERTTDAADLGAPVAAFDPKVDKKRREDEEEYQAYAKDLMQRLQKIKNTSTKEPQYSPDDYYGPSFGDDATANQQRMNNLYDYWKNNYKPAQQKQPFNISPITANDMPGPVKDFANNFPDYRNTEWGQNLDRLQNDPVWGPIINAGVSAVGAAVGSPQAARYAQRGMINPLGQRTTVRSGAAGRAQVPVYRGRPYQGDLKIGGGGPAFGTVDPKVAGTYTQSGPLRGTPGTKQSSQGTVDRGTLPQRYIDKYGGRSVLGQQQIKMSPSAAARTFGGTVTQPTQSKTLQNLTKVGATAAGAAAVLDAGAAEPNVSGKDLNKRISDRLPGYSIGDFAPTGKGDHYTAPILDPQGNPVMNPRTGKPVTIGGGLRGKNQYSNSALGTLTNAINDIKGGFADKTGQAKGSTKVSDTKTKPVTKTASKTQPKPSTRSTIKSMPASMMGKPSSAPAPSPQQTLNPLQTNPYKMYNYGTRGLKNIRFGYEPKGNLIAEKKMKSFKELTKQLYPGQPSPNGFPDTPPAQMSPNGYHPEYGKRGSMYNRMDRATAMAMPLTKDPEIDAKIIAARNQPK